MTWITVIDVGNRFYQATAYFDQYPLVVLRHKLSGETNFLLSRSIF